MMSTVRAIERNEARIATVKFLKEHFAGEIHDAKIRRFGKYKAEPVEKEGYGIVAVREGGKFKAYYVDPYIADSVNYTPPATTNAIIEILSWLNRGWFRPIYVNLNLGFQAYNLLRDFKRAWKLNPHTSLIGMIKKYKEAFPIAFSRIWGDIPDPIITEMQQNAMLSLTYNDINAGADEQDETMTEYLMNQYKILKKSTSNNIFIKAINFIEQIGNFIETLPKVVGYISRKESGRPMKEIAHEVRTYSGSPDFLRKGENYYAYNNIFLFSNAIKEGFRGDIEGSFKNPRTRSGFWWKTLLADFLPKLLMFLASLGVFGAALKEHYRKQTEYDKTNYITIPLGFDENGKAIYVRVPHDETGRLLSGIFWKMLNMRKENIAKSAGDVLSFTGGQLPSLSPAVEIPFLGWLPYFMGASPYDIQRGRTILTDKQKLAGGWFSLKPMFAWTASKFGAGSFFLKGGKEQGFAEKVLRFTPILGRFIKISDYGEKEELFEQRERRNKAKAIRYLRRQQVRGR